VAGIDDRGVAVDIEYSGGDVLEQLGEVAGLPGLSDATREPRSAGADSIRRA
jgi:hypothetical protein